MSYNRVGGSKRPSCEKAFIHVSSAGTGTWPSERPASAHSALLPRCMEARTASRVTERSQKKTTKKKIAVSRSFVRRRAGKKIVYRLKRARMVMGRLEDSPLSALGAPPARGPF